LFNYLLICRTPTASGATTRASGATTRQTSAATTTGR